MEATVVCPAGDVRQIIRALSGRERSEAEMALSTQIVAALGRRRYRDDDLVVLQMPAHQVVTLLAASAGAGVNGVVHPDLASALRRLAEGVQEETS